MFQLKHFPLVFQPKRFWMPMDYRPIEGGHICIPKRCPHQRLVSALDDGEGVASSAPWDLFRFPRVDRAQIYTIWWLGLLSI